MIVWRSLMKSVRIKMRLLSDFGRAAHLTVRFSFDEIFILAVIDPIHEEDVALQQPLQAFFAE